MKSERVEMITRFMLSIICFTVYFALVVAVLASAL